MAEDLASPVGGNDPRLKVLNPISADLGFMRPSLLPNLIQAAIRNHDRGQGATTIFEVGPQFGNSPEATTPQQLMATGIVAGQTGHRHWSAPPRPFDVFDAKSHVLAVLTALGISEASLQVDASGPDYYHPGRKGCFRQGNRTLALFGEIHPQIITQMAGEGAFAGFEVFLDQLPPLKLKKTTLHLSPYQPVVRDFAFVVDDAVSADQVIRAVAKGDRVLITAIHIFDIYKGDNLPKGKKSLAVQVRLEPQAGTLTDAQIAEVCEKVIASVSKTTGGGLRTL